MTLKERILGIIEKHDYWTDGSELASEEITALVEDFTQWCIINAFYQVFEDEYGLIDSDLHFKTASDLFEFWKLNVKETKGAKQ